MHLFSQEFQTTVDDLTEVSEGRRIAFFCLLSLLLFCLIPVDQIGSNMSTNFSALLTNASEYLRVAAATGAPPLKSNLF